MRRLFILMLVAVVAAGTAFAVTRWALATPPPADQLTWLRNEFHLNEAQARTIARLHADYAPVCAEHCRLIEQTRRRLDAAPGDPQAQASLAALELKCREATHRHLEAVAAAMPPTEGARFLALVGPKVSQHQHQAPFEFR